MYVYLKSESRLWTVGFYDPSGRWHSESDHDNPDAAARRVHWLNGGTPTVIYTTDDEAAMLAADRAYDDTALGEVQS